MEVLVALADHAGEVLSRDQLLSLVWQSRYVSDDVITQAIAELRRAFGDDFRHPVVVETVPRRGYRLIGTVRELHHTKPTAPADPPEALARSSPPETAAARDAGRWPLGRTAVVGVVAIAVVFVGWLSFRIGRDVNGDLVSQPGLRSGRVSIDTRPTLDTEAYEFYLKARETFQPHRNTAGRLDEALTLAQRAVARDPGFAEAHALIAEIQTIKGFWNQGPRDEILAGARQAANAALEINPHLSYPHAVAGLATGILEWKWEEGYRRTVHATELDPNDARSLSLRAALALTRGKSAEAVQMAYRAYELEPINPHALGILSWVLYQARHFDKAAEFMGKTLDADAEAPFAQTFRPLALAYAGRHDAALAAERARSAGHPSGRHALILILAGRREEARQYLLQQRPQYPETAWGHLGNKALLVARLNRLYERRMSNYMMWLRTGPDWDPIRDHPRFHEVLVGVGLVEENAR
jgi:DNA-binding winged helix-turn-helix (wHTH) protein